VAVRQEMARDGGWGPPLVLVRDAGLDAGVSWLGPTLTWRASPAASSSALRVSRLFWSCSCLLDCCHWHLCRSGRSDRAMRLTVKSAGARMRGPSAHSHSVCPARGRPCAMSSGSAGRQLAHTHTVAKVRSASNMYACIHAEFGKALQLKSLPLTPTTESCASYASTY
jgi:hypothetical protein